MALGFNPEFISVSYYTCFKSKEAFEDALDDLIVCNEQQLKKHESAKGIVRVPQETVPLLDENKKIIEHSRNGDGITIKGESVDSIEQRKAVKEKILNFIATQNVDVTKMNETVFTISLPKNEEKGTVSKTYKQAFFTDFSKTIFEFLDYIVPIISDDKNNRVSVTNVMYATQYNLLNPEVSYFKIIATSDLELSFIKQLWTLYVEFLQERGQQNSEAMQQQDAMEEEGDSDEE